MEIDFSGLEKKIEEVIGIPVQLNATVDTRGKELRIEFSTTDFTDKLGIKNVFQKMHAYNFGGSYDPEEEVFYVPVSVGWAYINGGTNGCSLFDARYDVKQGKWFFKNLP